MSSSASVAARVSFAGCWDEVVSTSYHNRMSSDVFEPREDNEGQPQETVG
ncbi:hypothetical protein [Sodalinema gerasimenkoae]|nr:hypothetical protein [Sodalinema gerasimenkoae]